MNTRYLLGFNLLFKMSLFVECSLFYQLSITEDGQSIIVVTVLVLPIISYFALQKIWLQLRKKNTPSI
jgi:hypothetical protein